MLNYAVTYIIKHLASNYIDIISFSFASTISSTCFTKTSVFFCTCSSAFLISSSDISEDEIKKAEEQVQKKTDVFVKQVDEIVDAKEKEIMSI